MGMGWSAAGGEACYPWDEPLQEGRGYPRPQLHRAGWISLNGPWDFAIDRENSFTLRTVQFDRSIEVPFAAETSRSGIGETGFFLATWYRRRFSAPEVPAGSRLMLQQVA